MKPQKALVSKKRPVNTYAELLHGSRILIERGQVELRGSKWLWMASLTLTAFSLEAYLNHIGPKIFQTWQDSLEKTLSPEGKLELICEVLKIDMPKDKRPRQTVTELIRFRNHIAHGKSVIIEKSTDHDVDQYLDEFLGKRPVAVWEEYCTERNALRAFDDVKEILKMIHDKANPENDPLFSMGIEECSAQILE
jgi:hypothetical protein